MIAVETHLAADTVALFDHSQNVCGVLPECRGHPVDIASQLIVADECRPEGAAKGEAFVENFRDQAFVGVVLIQPACATLGGLLLATFLLGEKFLVTRAIGALIIVCGLSVIGAEAVTTIGGHGIAGDLMFVLTGLMFATFGALLRLWHIAPIPATAVISVLSLFAAPVHWALGRFRSHDCVGMAGKLPADRLAGCGGGARSNLFVRPHSRSVGSGFEPAGRRPSHGHIPIPALLPNRHRLL